MRLPLLAMLAATSLLPQASSARTVPLLEVRAGQMPTDTGSDGLTKRSLEDCPELGGRALKVAYHAGDSFGDRQSRVTNWKEFTTLEFSVFNPGVEAVNLILTVKHRRTTSYQTRVEKPFTLKPGKNHVRLGIDELLNVNGSTPDLANVDRWYIACEPGKTPVLFFGDLELVGDDVQPPTGPAPASAGGPAPTYKLTGTIGDLPVDLLATPVPTNATPGPATARVTIDPARLARIRATTMPTLTQPVQFHTAEADAICSALEVFPPDNPWNQVVENWPLHPNSDALLASIGVDKPLRCNTDMGFVLVPPDQPRVPVKIVTFPEESDPGPYPVPDSIPIEGWPVAYMRAQGAAPPLEAVQRSSKGGDRHGIVVDPLNRMLYEFFALRRTDDGWQAAQASVFDLKTSKLRPNGWTSADAAGLPIFPAVVRHDELQRGLVEHAMRVTVRHTRRAYVAPATHFASSHDNADYPRMGERLRLKASVDLSGFSPEAQALLRGLKKYGMFVADNGIEWAISIAPDPRIPDLQPELRKLTGAAFEVVVAPE